MSIDVLHDTGAYEAGIKGVSLIFEMLVVIIFIICSVVISKIENKYIESSLLKYFLTTVTFISGLVLIFWITQFITHIYFWDWLVKYINNIF